MSLRLPAGKPLAVSIGVDFDAEVGTPRLLRLFAKHGIPTTGARRGTRFIVHIKQHDDVWFATLSDIYDCRRDD